MDFTEIMMVWLKLGKKSLHQNEKLNFVFSLHMELLKTFFKKDKKKDKKTELQQTLNFKTKSDF